MRGTPLTPKAIPQDKPLHAHLNRLSRQEQAQLQSDAVEAYHKGVRPMSVQQEAVVMDNLTMAHDLEVFAGPIPAPPKKDNVVMPAHYGHFKIEPVRFSIENGMDPFQFNIIKYTTRHKLKNGVEDIQKVIRYAQMYIKYLEGDPDWWRASS